MLISFPVESLADVELEKAVEDDTHVDSAGDDSLTYSTSDGASRTSTPLPDRDRSTHIPERATNIPPPHLPGKYSGIT